MTDQAVFASKDEKNNKKPKIKNRQFISVKFRYD
jgi:hypothetical protein